MNDARFFFVFVFGASPTPSGETRKPGNFLGTRPIEDQRRPAEDVAPDVVTDIGHVIQRNNMQTYLGNRPTRLPQHQKNSRRRC